MEWLVRTYMPSEVHLVVNGYKVVGWNKISVKPTQAAFQLQKGIRGTANRVASNDQTLTLTLELEQTSVSNLYLSNLLKADLGNKIPTSQLILKDWHGGTEFSTDLAFLTGWPDVSYAEEMSTRQWEFQCIAPKDFKVKGGGSLREALAAKLKEKGLSGISLQSLGEI